MNADLGAELGGFSAAVQTINNVLRLCYFPSDLLGIGKARIVQLVIGHRSLVSQTVQQMPCIFRNRIVAVLQAVHDLYMHLFCSWQSNSAIPEQHARLVKCAVVSPAYGTAQFRFR